MPLPRSVIRLEAEDARLTGVTIATARPGYSGKGYVTGFRSEGDRLVFPAVRALPGIYTVRIRYSAPMGEKGYDLLVNGAKFSGMLARTGDVFATHDAGRVELKAGDNTVGIGKGWGYYDVDYIELAPAPAPRAPRRPASVPVDRAATSRTRALLRYLVEIYGVRTLSGQYDPADTDLIRAATGKTPAIFGTDLIDYSPSRVAHGAKPGNVEPAIARARQAGQIVTVSWHWNAPSGLLDTGNAPWYKGFYTNATTFDVQRALADPNGEDYKLLLRDIDAIAIQLRKFAAAGIPLLWRPLHEAEGGWFWWGAKGPEPFKRLWRLLFDRLTHRHGLHNLLWVFTTGSQPEWYPGDACVDILGVDAYPPDPADPLSETWDSLLARYDGRKLLALTEFGGVPDIERMERFGVRWAYFVSWTGDLGPKKTPEMTKRTYRSPYVQNAGDRKRTP